MACNNLSLMSWVCQPSQFGYMKRKLSGITELQTKCAWLFRAKPRPLVTGIVCLTFCVGMPD
eukprot:8833673-Ditylum_brightwellii.AAC.1